MNNQTPSPQKRDGTKKNRMEIVVKQQKATVRQVLADVYEEVNWAYLAKIILASHVLGFITSSVE